MSASADANDALRRENDQLRTALATRIVIEQAKGILAGRLDIGLEEAFRVLRREARNRRINLHTLAFALTEREEWADAIFEPGGSPSAAANGLAGRSDAPPSVTTPS